MAALFLVVISGLGARRVNKLWQLGQARHPSIPSRNLKLG